MWSRISNIRKQGKVVFIDVIKQGVLLECKISANETQEFEKYNKQIYRGLLVNITQHSEGVSRTGSKLYVILEMEYPVESSFFPENYPKSKVKDKEILYKNRCLSMITNPDLFLTIKSRVDTIQHIKQFFRSLGAAEIDLPVLESSFGGAFARPMSTHINAINKDYFLRTSFEFPLKRLIIAGFSNVYAIGSAFRNEGVDRTHTPEYLHLEYYTTTLKYRQVQKLVDKLYAECYYNTHGHYDYWGFDLKKEWPVYTKEMVLKLLEDHHLTQVDDLIDLKVLGPCFHIEAIKDENPLGIFPFVFDSYVDYTMEIVTAYQEENDPTKLSKKGRLSEILDATFQKDLTYGMPPAVGLGLGIDRVVKSILNAESIRDIQLYPLI